MDHGFYLNPTILCWIVERYVLFIWNCSELALLAGLLLFTHVLVTWTCSSSSVITRIIHGVVFPGLWVSCLSLWKFSVYQSIDLQLPYYQWFFRFSGESLIILQHSHLGQDRLLCDKTSSVQPLSKLCSGGGVVTPAAQRQLVRSQTPAPFMSKCPWARPWTPNPLPKLHLINVHVSFLNPFNSCFSSIVRMWWKGDRRR